MKHWTIAGLALLLAAAGQPCRAESKNDPVAVGFDSIGDLQPHDWHYQALASLNQHQHCHAAVDLNGQQSISRLDAADLLNSCMQAITSPTDVQLRLMRDLAPELDQLAKREQQLTARLANLEAQTFSTTTRLNLESFWVLGGNSYSGNAINTTTNSYSIPGSSANIGLRNAITFNYDIRLNVSTSWSGKDLLYTRLRAGNFFFGSGFGSDVYNNMATLDASFGNGPFVRIDRLYYKFPIGDSISVMLGPRVRNTEILGFRPQAYDGGILDYFTLAGAPTVYNKANGAGAGFSWRQRVAKGKPYWIAAASYVAEFGEYGDPGKGGLFSANGANNINLQLGSRGSNWALVAGYRYGTCLTDSRSGTAIVMEPGTLFCNGTNAPANDASSHSIAIGGYWQPEQSGWIPSISLGLGYSNWQQSTELVGLPTKSSFVSSTQSWSAMFQWNRVGNRSGHAAGFALGQGTMASTLRTGGNPADSNYAFEWWYRFKLSDAISITPAVFYLSNPVGQRLAAQGQSLNNLGFLIQTRFLF
ncbi:MAG: carbohydrate porin [Cyanobacteria bacterium K_DeepCast_35m_m2_023]|nr:carbohydrate porin [Cyanobacteria bacterium K_DeepCast_35m_m2_023]